MVKNLEKKAAKQQAKAEKRTEQTKRLKQQRKAQAVLSKAKIAEQLRTRASQVEAGTFVLGDKELELPPYAGFEISYKLRRRGGHQIEVEIDWGSPTNVPLLPSE